MGAAGDVYVYDFQKLDDEHRRRFGRALVDDWNYAAPHEGKHRALVVELDGKKWLTRYADDQGYHDSAEDFWCASDPIIDDMTPHERVMQTIGAVGHAARTEVWT